MWLHCEIVGTPFDPEWRTRGEKELGPEPAVQEAVAGGRAVHCGQNRGLSAKVLGVI